MGLFKKQNNPRNKPAAIKALQNPRREGHLNAFLPLSSPKLPTPSPVVGGKRNFICPGCLPPPPDSPQNSGFWSSPQGPAPPALSCRPPFILCVCSGGGGLAPDVLQVHKKSYFPPLFACLSTPLPPLPFCLEFRAPSIWRIFIFLTPFFFFSFFKNCFPLSVK